MDLRNNFSQNLILHRKALNLTQAELAEKINYSDKAVSKWERGEGLPDLEVAKTLADLFGTSVDALIGEPKKEKPRLNYNLPKKRVILCMCCAVLVWLVAIFTYSFIGVIFPTLLHKAWLAIIYAISITFIVLLVLTCVWGKNLFNAIFSSLLSWTTILAVYLSLINFLKNPARTLWMIFLIGIPLQVLIILWFSYKKVK